MVLHTQSCSTQSLLLSVIATSCFLATIVTTRTQAAEPDLPLWSASEARTFCDRLPLATDSQLSAAMDEFYAVFNANETINPSNLKYLDFAEAASILERAIELEWGILDLITERSLSGESGCAFFMDRQTLSRIDRQFDIHGLWMINAPMSDNQVLAMDFILFGQGRLIIGYPESAEVAVEDYPARLLLRRSNLYEYEPYLVANIVETDGRRGIVNINTLSSPDADLDDFSGPFNVSIQSIFLLPGSRIRIAYVLGASLGKTIDNIPIERR